MFYVTGLDKFHQTTENIEASLSKIHYYKLDLSEEVREQVEIVHAQFRRAKGRPDSPESQLDFDLAIAESEKDLDPAILRRLSKKLQLKTIDDLKKGCIAFLELVVSSDGHPGDWFDKMSNLLKKLKDYIQVEVPEADTSNAGKSFMKHRSPVIPDEFRCQISLELMKDPVILPIGQTHERSCIQRRLDAGHKTCPKTQQTLLHTALTPNYVLKSLIAFWCESNGVELPKQEACRTKKVGSRVSVCDQTAIVALIDRLENGSLERQRAVAGELHLLAKRNANNRELLKQELFHWLWSCYPPIIQGPENMIMSELYGSIETRENAAATLFSLSVIGKNKVSVRAAWALPSLMMLLCERSPRGKKDAATAIFNLSIYQGNKARAISASIVPPLMRLLKDAGGGMVDGALASLAILASIRKGSQRSVVLSQFLLSWRSSGLVLRGTGRMLLLSCDHYALVICNS